MALLAGLLTCAALSRSLEHLLGTRMIGTARGLAVAGVLIIELLANSLSNSLHLTTVALLAPLILHPSLEEAVRFHFVRRARTDIADAMSISLMIGTLEAVGKTIWITSSFPITGFLDPVFSIMFLAILCSFMFHINMGLVAQKLLAAEAGSYQLVLLIILHGLYNLLTSVTDPPSLFGKNVHLLFIALLNGALLLRMLPAYKRRAKLSRQ